MIRKKNNIKFHSKFLFANAPVWTKKLCNDCKTNHLNKNFPHQKQIAEKQGFKGKVFILITESRLISKALYHHPQKKNQI